MALPANINIVNHDAETGDLTGWNIETGDVIIRTTNPSPINGSSYFWVGVNEPLTVFSQMIDIPPANIADVNLGTTAVNMQWLQTNEGYGDECRLNLVFFNGINEIHRKNGIYFATAGSWEVKQLQYIIPANTTKIKIEFESKRNFGNNADTYIDNVSMVLDNVLIDNRLTLVSSNVIIKDKNLDYVSHVSLTAISKEFINVEVSEVSIDIIMSAPPLVPSPNHIPSSVNVNKF